MIKKRLKLSHLACDNEVGRTIIYDIHLNSEKILMFVNTAILYIKLVDWNIYSAHVKMMTSRTSKTTSSIKTPAIVC